MIFTGKQSSPEGAALSCSVELKHRDFDGFLIVTAHRTPEGSYYNLWKQTGPLPIGAIRIRNEKSHPNEDVSAEHLLEFLRSFFEVNAKLLNILAWQSAKAYLEKQIVTLK